MTILLFPFSLFLLILLLTVAHQLIYKRVLMYSKIYFGADRTYLDLKESINPLSTMEEGKEFLYRPILNEVIFVKDHEFSFYGTFAFIHELYHSLDRKRVLIIQSISFAILYFVSPMLKILVLSRVLLENMDYFFTMAVRMNILLLLIVLFLKMYIEIRASNASLRYIKSIGSISLAELKSFRLIYFLTLSTQVIPIISSMLITLIPWITVKFL